MSPLGSFVSVSLHEVRGEVGKRCYRFLTSSLNRVISIYFFLQRMKKSCYVIVCGDNDFERIIG